MDPMDTGDTTVKQTCNGCGDDEFGIYLNTATGWYVISCLGCGDRFTLYGQQVW
jgi:hypothetical protein